MISNDGKPKFSPASFCNHLSLVRGNTKIFQVKAQQMEPLAGDGPTPQKQPLQPFNSYDWPRQNFSLEYHYNINQISDENKEK